MPVGSSNRSVFFVSRTGCLLPFLLLFNLLFGWMFLKPLAWLSIEAVLFLLFILNTRIAARKFTSTSLKRRGAIDVEGEDIRE